MTPQQAQRLSKVFDHIMAVGEDHNNTPSMVKDAWAELRELVDNIISEEYQAIHTVGDGYTWPS